MTTRTMNHKKRHAMFEWLDGVTDLHAKIKLPDDSVISYGSSNHPEYFIVTVYDIHSLDACLHHDLPSLALSYIDAKWTCDNLYKLLYRVLSPTHSPLPKNPTSLRKYLLSMLAPLLQNRTRYPNKQIQNDFFTQFLDSSMTFSAALFDSSQINHLHLAQRRKHQRVFRQIQTSCTHTILDIHAAWGSFMELAIEKGMTVDGICHHHDQASFSKQRLENTLTPGSYKIFLNSLPDGSACYDAVVSIEHLELIPPQQWADYFKKIHRLLRPGGKVLIQTTLCCHTWQQYPILKHLFPNHHFGTHDHLKKSFSPYFSLVDQFRMNDDYCNTLRLWHSNLTTRRNDSHELGFSDREIRMWQFMLSFARACFAHDYAEIAQFTLLKSPL